MKVILQILALVGMFIFVGGEETFATDSLQSLINATPEGGTLKLPKVTYNESIVIKRAIHIEGTKGTLIRDCSTKPVISVEGENVTLQTLKIEGCEKSSAAIYMSGKSHELTDIEIEITSIGIKLFHTENSRFHNIFVSGIATENAIDLWESHRNRFDSIQIFHVQDGFYMENSHHNQYLHNSITDSRYGLHVMFSNHTLIQNNVSKRNSAGAMIMGTEESDIQENDFSLNNQNVHSQGLLLYDVHDSIISNNRISSNRVGILIEDSTSNEIRENEFTANYIGAQIRNISKNKLEENSFTSNVNDLHALGDSENVIRNNFWDSAGKLDIDGDGKSNLPFRADPYFLNLTNDVPAYQLFFQHPGMVFLQKMLKSTESTVITDESPMMNQFHEHDFDTTKNTAEIWGLSLFMLLLSLFFFYMGRKSI